MTRKRQQRRVERLWGTDIVDRNGGDWFSTLEITASQAEEEKALRSERVSLEAPSRIVMVRLFDQFYRTQSAATMEKYYTIVVDFDSPIPELRRLWEQPVYPQNFLSEDIFNSQA